MGAIQSADGNDSRSATDAFDSLDLRGLDVSAVRALADAWGLRKLNFGLEHSAVESAIEEQLRAQGAEDRDERALRPIDRQSAGRSTVGAAVDS